MRNTFVYHDFNSLFTVMSATSQHMTIFGAIISFFIFAYSKKTFKTHFYISSMKNNSYVSGFRPNPVSYFEN